MMMSLARSRSFPPAPKQLLVEWAAPAAKKASEQVYAGLMSGSGDVRMTKRAWAQTRVIEHVM